MGPKVTVMRISCFNISIEDNNIESVHKIYFCCFMAPNSFIFYYSLLFELSEPQLWINVQNFSIAWNIEVRSKKEKTHFCTPCIELEASFLKKMSSRKWLCLLSPPPQYLDLRIPSSEIELAISCRTKLFEHKALSIKWRRWGWPLAMHPGQVSNPFREGGHPQPRVQPLSFHYNNWRSSLLVNPFINYNHERTLRGRWFNVKSSYNCLFKKTGGPQNQLWR